MMNDALTFFLYYYTRATSPIIYIYYINNDFEI